MAVLVKSENLKKVFRLGKTEIPALRGVDLEIEEGEFSVLAGPSGSGKTTLLNLVGLIDSPDEGRLEFSGRDISKLGERGLKEIRKTRIGFVFQNFNLVPVLMAYENVEYPFHPPDFLSGKKRRRICRILLFRYNPSRLDRQPLRPHVHPEPHLAS